MVVVDGGVVELVVDVEEELVVDVEEEVVVDVGPVTWTGNPTIVPCAYSWSE